MRDATIFPRINRADYAVTIYPPVAEFFFLVVTRVGENVTVMRLGLLGCEAVSVIVILLLLKRMRRPLTRVVAYVWHPLPIWEIANSGHVDALMVSLMLLGLWMALSGRALRGAVVIAWRAREAVCGPGARGNLAPLGLENAARGHRHGCAVLPAISFGWMGCSRVPDERLPGGRGFISGDDIWPFSLWRLAFGVHRGDVAIYAFAASIVLLMALFAARRAKPTVAASLANINMLLLAVSCCCRPIILGTFWR